MHAEQLVVVAELAVAEVNLIEQIKRRQLVMIAVQSGEELERILLFLLPVLPGWSRVVFFALLTCVAEVSMEKNGMKQECD